MPLSVSEKLLYTTIKLLRFRGGQSLGSGTGFFYNVALGNNKAAPLIVTNKHVVQGCDRIDLVCHQAQAQDVMEPSGKFLNLSINIGPDGAPGHPNPDVDLCMLPIAEIIDKASLAATPILFGLLPVWLTRT